MKRGAEFEHAVHDFVSRLFPDARVLFDHFVSDVDTGRPRQVDVWIEGSIGGIAITVLVSCKDHRRRLDVGQIGTFLDEVRSTGANTGIIYSRSGFTKDAILKAQKRSVSCCRLYRNAPADIPSIISVSHYLAVPSFRLIGPAKKDWHDRLHWRDYLYAVIESPNRTLLDILDQIFHASQTKAILAASTNKHNFPEARAVKISASPENGDPPFEVVLDTFFIYYRARVEAHFLNGSYCVSTPNFVGEIFVPVVSFNGFQPGPGWEQISELPDPSTKYRVVAMRARTILAMLDDRLIAERLDASRSPKASDENLRGAGNKTAQRGRGTQRSSVKNRRDF